MSRHPAGSLGILALLLVATLAVNVINTYLITEAIKNQNTSLGNQDAVLAELRNSTDAIIDNQNRIESNQKDIMISNQELIIQLLNKSATILYNQTRQ